MLLARLERQIDGSFALLGRSEARPAAAMLNQIRGQIGQGAVVRHRRAQPIGGIV